MGFDDDMIEAGFWDGNDYLDYLIDEGDRALQDIYDKQEVFWAQGGLSVADGCRCLTKELDMIAC